MTDAYRNDHEAALRHIEALREENRVLRDLLESQACDVPSLKRRPQSALPSLLAGLFFLAGAVTIAGSVASRAPRSGCPHASWAAGQRASLEQARQLSEPGTIRVEGLADLEEAQVSIDGMIIPRSGGMAYSGPLTGHQNHHLAVTSPGYLSFNTTIGVLPSTAHGISVQLTPIPPIDPSATRIINPWSTSMAAVR